VRHVSSRPTPHPLDHAAWASLTGPHRDLSEGDALARRYRPSVSPFFAIGDQTDRAAWSAAETLLGPGEDAVLTNLGAEPPAGWGVDLAIDGVQMVATDDLVDRLDDEVVVLGPDDVDDMLALVARTQPGPFERETRLMGTYRGIRRDGQLVAMAGERMHPPGWTEISAVCTDAVVRGQGLASRLVLAVAHGIRSRGERPSCTRWPTTREPSGSTNSSDSSCDGT
jgi:hypothetical protein